MLYTPSFGEPFSAATQFARDRGAAPGRGGRGTRGDARIATWGETLKTVPLPADTALPDGRLMLVGRVPIDDVSAGEYELQRDGDAGRADGDSIGDDDGSAVASDEVVWEYDQ